MRLGRPRAISATLLFAAIIVIITDHVVSAAPALELLKLAEGEFSNLTPAETALLKFAGSLRSEPGGFAAAGPSGKPDDPSNDPAHADNWGKEREVRAELIEWLCVDESAKKLVPRGIRLLGARITGKLDLAHVTIPFALTLRNCSIGERMTFENMALPQLDLSGCYTGEIDAENIVIHGNLLMNDLHASGGASFPNSTIGGNLLARGSHFTHSKVEAEGLGLGNMALDAGGAQIRGVVEFCCGFEADGAVNLANAAIGSDMIFTGGTFNGANDVAIDANAANFSSAAFLGTHPLITGYRGVHVNGLVQMRVMRANALVVQDATFSGAPNEQHGFDLRSSSVRIFVWLNVTLNRGAIVDLSGASLGSLIDEPRRWPAPGKLELDGLTYDQLGGPAIDARSRLQWLALQPEFHLQPYRQLAKLLRNNGDDSGAAEVLIAAEDRRYASHGRASALGGGFLNATIGYGHKPLRTIGWSVLVILLGWPIVWAAKRAGVMRPTFPENIPHSSEPGYEELHPLLYSLDAFLPFVNLHQEHYWWPNSKAAGDCVVLGHKFRLRGSLVRHYLWLQIFSGWLLSAILIAGVTGLMRSD
ncbi:MAG TPA: hypothetical protein VJX23_17440 [Candidatus Binataceae bacterium]|nr:hypothetical protein [Candidatus Binataceae bacterium]